MSAIAFLFPSYRRMHGTRYAPLTTYGARMCTFDLPPTNRASRSLVKFVFGEEDEHEEALYGTANHRVSEGSRGRYAGQGTVQEAWVQ
ncbi:hypothetical protein BOC49_30555 [Burkholderia pseudomallei]|nr:hypothetical protein BOC49_30555 [Burkholderia pseudomallei]